MCARIIYNIVFATRLRDPATIQPEKNKKHKYVKVNYIILYMCRYMMYNIRCRPRLPR